MTDVTRDDVLRACETWDANGDDPLGMFDHLADALIAAFPHLVGEVETIGTRYLEPEFGVRATATQVVYTVAGPWQEVER